VTVVVRLVVASVVVAAVAWFGFVAVATLQDRRAVGDRNDVVAQAWTQDPAAVTKAATGAVTTPAGLTERQFWQAGAAPTRSYSVSGATLTLNSESGYCVGHPQPQLTVDVVESPVDVQVLVYEKRSWLPDLATWSEVLRTGGAGCSGVGASATVTATLSLDLGKRFVVDAVTGSSVELG
jgi:hypothetical protein